MHHNPELTVVIFVSMTLAVGAAMKLFSARTHFPYTIAMLLLGLATGVILHRIELGEDLTVISESIKAGAQISPHLIIFVFLPALIFESAYAMDLYAFRKSLGTAVFLAGPALLVATGLTGLLMYNLTRLADIPWSLTATLVFGALISATDPVAVVALLRELGVSKKLATLIESESLLNDGTSIVVFTVLLGLLTGEGDSFSLGSTLIEFVKVVAGGLVVGVLLAMFLSWWIGRTFNDPLIEITLTIVLGYAAMIVAEGILHVSGVMAVVVAGLWMSGPGRTKVSPEVFHFLHRFWEMLAYIANTLIFYIVGLIIGTIQQRATFIDIALILGAYIGIMVIRFGVTFMFLPIANTVGARLRPADAVVASWGGLRGAVSLALALVLSKQDIDSVPHQEILLVTAGVVFLTILVNGTTMKGVLAHFGYDKQPLSEQIALLTALTAVLDRIREGIRQVSRSRELQTVSWVDVEKDIEKRSQKLHKELHENRDRLEQVAESERVAGYWRQVLNMEREAYWHSFAQGTLSAAAVRILNHELDLQIDRLARGQVEPPETRTPPLGGVRVWFGRLLRNSSLLSRRFVAFEFENLALIYNLSHAESAAASQVLQNLKQFKDIDPAVAQEMHDTYCRYLRLGKERVEEMRLHLPEVTCAIETQIAQRIALNFERQGYQSLANKGAIDETTAQRLEETVEEQMQRLSLSPKRVPLPDIPELLCAIPLFKSLDEKALEQIADAAQTVALPAGEYLFHQNDRGDSMYVILRGAAQVLQDVNDSEQLLDVLGGGDILGEIALLTGEHRTASIRAGTSLYLVRIGREAFNSLIEVHPQIGTQVWDSFAQHRFDNYLRQMPEFRYLDHRTRLRWIQGCEHLDIDQDKMCEVTDAAFVFVLTGMVKTIYGEHHAPALIQLDRATMLLAEKPARVVALPPLDEALNSA